MHIFFVDFPYIPNNVCGPEASQLLGDLVRFGMRFHKKRLDILHLLWHESQKKKETGQDRQETEDRTGQDSTDMTGQDRTGQDRTRQDKTT